tara:strand:+ start:1676 stop:2164 length:489 start_codon:yes stop_codon:yes gene_type:complete
MAVKEEVRINLDAALHRVGEYFADEVREQLLRDGLHASGELAASIEAKVIDGSIDILNAKYGGAIDEGANRASQGYNKISKAYIQNIMSWATMKGITPDKGGSMKGMAFAIAKTIKKNGLVQRFGNSGAKIYDRVYKELEERIGVDLMAGYSEDLKDKLNKL